MLFFFVAVTNLSVYWCSPSVGKTNSNAILIENDKLTVDCFKEDTSECLIQLELYESIKKLHLKGFVFDEVNVKQFSNAICKMQLQDLTLYQCDINDELVSQLTIPSDLKSIRLERLNLSLKGIQSIIDKLSDSLESLEVIDCLVSELSQHKLPSDSILLEASLDFSNFSHLKTICIDNLNVNFDSLHLLLSLTMLPLETIKLSSVYLIEKEWTKLLNEWKETNKVAFFKTLKEFDLKIENIDRNLLARLIRFLFSIPRLEIISIYSSCWIGKISLPPLPSTIKQLSLARFEIFIEDEETPFYNSKNLSHLTHLIIYDPFEIFPNDSFNLNQLECLKICSFKDCKFSLKKNQCYYKVKHLSIHSEFLIPLLTNFENNFPLIETVVIYSAELVNFKIYWKKIISNKALKFLQLNFFHSDQYYFDIKGEIKSSIEELKLINISWDFVTILFPVELFPHLKNIYIDFVKYGLNLDLGEIIKRLSSFPQLASLALKGFFYSSNVELSFRFENLIFFHLDSFQGKIDLDHLLNCMPNLIELQLEGRAFGEFKLHNPIGIRYLRLPYHLFWNNGDLINVVKNTPNLVQLTTKESENSPIQSIPYASELAYYLKKLKKHFQNELQFEIHPNCLPIKLLKSDVKLEKLIRLKSPELPNYLKDIFSNNSSGVFVKQLFTIDIEKYFNVETTDIKLVMGFFILLSELEIEREEDFSFIKKLLLEKNEYFSETTDFSLHNFFKLFSDSLTKGIGVSLESVHLEFIKEFYKANKKYGLLKVFNFLKPFFISLSIGDAESKSINREKFDFFSGYLLTSFCSLFDKIKEDKLEEEEKKFIPSRLELIAEDLKTLEPEEYEELSIKFMDIFMELYDESFVESLFDILKTILISETKCAICIDSLLTTKECKFFKSKKGNCHLFHKDCLEVWLNESSSCPYCRKSI